MSNVAVNYPTISQAELNQYGAAPNPTANCWYDDALALARFCAFLGLPVKDLCINFINAMGGPSPMPIIPVTVLVSQGLNVMGMAYQFVMAPVELETGYLNSAACLSVLNAKDSLGRPLNPIQVAIARIAADFGLNPVQRTGSDYSVLDSELLADGLYSYLGEVWDALQAGKIPPQRVLQLSASAQF